MIQIPNQNIEDEQCQSFSSKPNKIDNVGISPHNVMNQIPKRENIMTVKDGLVLEENNQINNGQYQNINQNFHLRGQLSNNIAGNFTIVKTPNFNQNNLPYNNIINFRTPQKINNQANNMNQYIVNQNQIPPINIYQNPQNIPIIKQNQNQMNIRPPQNIINVPQKIINPENNQIVQKKIYINPQRINSPQSPQYGTNQQGQIKIIKQNFIQRPNKLFPQ